MRFDDLFFWVLRLTWEGDFTYTTMSGHDRSQQVTIKVCSRLRRGDCRYTTYFITMVYLALYQSSLSKHFIKALYQSTLSKNFIKALYQSTLSKAFYQSTLSKHFIKSLYPSTLSKHVIKVFLKSFQKYLSNIFVQLICRGEVSRSITCFCLLLVHWVTREFEKS